MKNGKTSISALVAVLLSSAFAMGGCDFLSGLGATPTPTPEASPAATASPAESASPAPSATPTTSISLDNTNGSLRPWRKMQLRATVLPAGANQAITWSVSKPGVVSVDQAGLVTPIAPGSCLVTATTFDGRSASCQILIWGNDSDGNARLLIDDASFKGSGWWKPMGIINGVDLREDPLSLTMRQASGSIYSGYGIHFCHVDYNNFYSVNIRGDGRYRFFKRVAGSITTIQDWTANGDLEEGIGALNAVSISMAAPDAITISFNGQPGIVFHDSSFSTGGLAPYVAVNPAEDFPATPLDIRYKITAPMTFPSEHRYEVYSTSAAMMNGMTSSQIQDMGFAPWRSAYHGVLTPLGYSGEDASKTFTAGIGENRILVCAPPENEGFASVDAIQLLNPSSDVSFGYYGLDYNDNSLSASSHTANTPNYANAEGAPDGNAVRIGTASNGDYGFGGFALYHMDPTLNALPSGMTEGLTTMRVRVHCAP